MLYFVKARSGFDFHPLPPSPSGNVSHVMTSFRSIRYESQMELLKKSHSREMDKLKRSSGDGGDGLQTEVVQLQVEMENMSQKYMEEIETLKVCCVDGKLSRKAANGVLH